MAQWVAATIRRYRYPLAIGLASRAYSGLLILLAATLPSQGSPLLTDAASPFATFDGQWYLSIAERGYHAEPLVAAGDGGYHDFAFFPLWPLLIRLATVGILPAELVAVLLANVLWVLAMVPTQALLARLCGEQAARRGLMLLAFGPAAYVGSLAYSEPLYMLLAAVFLLTPVAAGWRPLIAIAAQLTRLTGVALSVAALVGSLRRPLTRMDVLTAAAAPSAFVSWWGFVWWLTGDPGGYLRGSPAWYGVAGDPSGLGSIVGSVLEPNLHFVVSMLTVIAIAAASVRLLAWNVEAATYALSTVAATVLFANWVNMPRHSLIALPAFAVLGRWLPPGRAGMSIVLAAALAQAFLVVGAIGLAKFPP